MLPARHVLAFVRAAQHGEHALLDDTGDGLGSRLPIDDLPPAETDENCTDLDGALASVIYIKDFSFPPTVPQKLIERYLSTLQKIDELKRKKGSMERDQYHADLEPKAARAANQIYDATVGRVTFSPNHSVMGRARSTGCQPVDRIGWQSTGFTG